MRQLNIHNDKHCPCGEDAQAGDYFRHSYGESIRKVDTIAKARNASIYGPLVMAILQSLG